MFDCRLNVPASFGRWAALFGVVATLGFATRGHADPAQDVAAARAQLAKQKSSLAAYQALLREAQAEPAGPEREEMIGKGQQAIDQQQIAVRMAQDRLDMLLGCTALRGQWEQDLVALKRHQASIEAGLKELDAWTAQNEAAQIAAVKLAETALFDGIIGHFAASFSTRLDVSEKALRGMPGDRFDRWFRADYDALRKNIAILQGGRDGLRLVQTGRSALALWNGLHDYSQEAQHTAATISTLARKIAGNRLFLQAAEQAALIAAANDFEKRLIKANFPLVRDAAKLGNFLIDYSYEVVRWTASRNRILDAYKLTEQQLTATQALRCQIERSVFRMQTCRGEPVRELSEGCRKDSP